MKIAIETDLPPDLETKFNAIKKKSFSVDTPEASQHLAILLLEIGIETLFVKMFLKDQ